jgi:hypothetical protein
MMQETPSFERLMPTLEDRRRRRTVYALSTLSSEELRRCRRGYDASTVPFIIPIVLVAILTAVVPVRVMGAGPASVRFTGNVTGATHLQAVLYAAFGPDLPSVFLRRQSLSTDADGNFDSTVSIAPATFSGEIVTVLVQTAAGVTVGRGSITIDDPAGTAADHS